MSHRISYLLNMLTSPGIVLALVLTVRSSNARRAGDTERAYRLAVASGIALYAAFILRIVADLIWPCP
jgi:3,4-dihydroxy-2-butanone 4-phosphate synthase